MLAQNIKITFIATSSGWVQKTLLCDYALFGLDLVGEVNEMVDYSLEENYPGVRQTIELKVKLDLHESFFMADFLGSTDKVLKIDGLFFDVVNDMRQASFELFKKTMISSHVTLKFKAKTLGVKMPPTIKGGSVIGVIE